MNRRGFLKGMLALSAAPAIVKAGSLMPLGRIWTHSAGGIITLYGDGVTDDTLALQALINGQRVMYGEEILQASGREVYVPRGHYAISDTLHVDGGQSLTMHNSILSMRKPIDYMLKVDSPSAVELVGVHFNTASFARL